MNRRSFLTWMGALIGVGQHEGAAKFSDLWAYDNMLTPNMFNDAFKNLKKIGPVDFYQNYE